MSGGLLAERRGVIVGFSGAQSVAYHCARLFVDEGASVALTSRVARLDELAADADAAGAALHLALDADDPQSMADAFARIDAEWGALDFVLHTLVHVPDGVLQRPLTEISQADFHAALDASVLSYTRVAALAAPLLRRSAAPRMLCLSSESSMLATPNYHIAGISKAALESTSRYLALELGRDGILCNVLSFSALASSGAVATVGEDNIERTRTHLAKRSMTGRACDWHDVASTAAWLCSAALRNMSGQKIVVDGGYSAAYF